MPVSETEQEEKKESRYYHTTLNLVTIDFLRISYSFSGYIPSARKQRFRRHCQLKGKHATELNNNSNRIEL